MMDKVHRIINNLTARQSTIREQLRAHTDKDLVSGMTNNFTRAPPDVTKYFVLYWTLLPGPQQKASKCSENILKSDDSVPFYKLVKTLHPKKDKWEDIEEKLLQEFPILQGKVYRICKLDSRQTFHRLSTKLDYLSYKKEMHRGKLWIMPENNLLDTPARSQASSSGGGPDQQSTDGVEMECVDDEHLSTPLLERATNRISMQHSVHLEIYNGLQELSRLRKQQSELHEKEVNLIQRLSSLLEPPGAALSDVDSPLPPPKRRRVLKREDEMETSEALPLHDNAILPAAAAATSTEGSCTYNLPELHLVHYSFDDHLPFYSAEDIKTECERGDQDLVLGLAVVVEQMSRVDTHITAIVTGTLPSGTYQELHNAFVAGSMRTQPHGYAYGYVSDMARLYVESFIRKRFFYEKPHPRFPVTGLNITALREVRGSEKLQAILQVDDVEEQRSRQGQYQAVLKEEALTELVCTHFLVTYPTAVIACRKTYHKSLVQALCQGEALINRRRSTGEFTGELQYD